MKTLNEMFIPYELALIAKGKGFQESCFGGYSSSGELKITMTDFQSDIKEFCLAPLYDQILNWFKDKHNLHFYIVPYGDCEHWNLTNIGRTDLKTDNGRLDYTIRAKYSEVKFKTYYEALNTAIGEGLKLILDAPEPKEFE